MNLWILLALHPLLIFGAEGITNGSDEHRLREFLLKDHDKDVRPVLRASDAVIVTFGLKLGQLAKVFEREYGDLGWEEGVIPFEDNKRQAMTTIVWVTQYWKDPYLKWNISDFGNISLIHMNPNDIWVPDTVLYNNADEETPMAGYLTKFQTKVMVKNDGTCIWMSPATFTSTCSINVRYWPFDNQECLMTFGSWSYGKTYVEYRAGATTTINTRLSDDFLTNGDWDIERFFSRSNTRLYSCCPSAFSDVTVRLVLIRKPLYHCIHLVLPIAILSLLTLANFAIPVASGERIGYVVTILLSMLVFLLLLADTLPETSDVVPLLEIFVILTLCTIFTCLLATTVVMSCYHKEGTPPKWLQNLCRKSSCKKPSNLKASVKPQEEKEKITLEVVEEEASSGPDAPTPLPSELTNEEQLSWKEVSSSIDRIFFLFFLVIPISFFIALLAVPLNV